MSAVPIAHLVGARVIVRTATENDAPEYARYFRENEAHLGRWAPSHDAASLTIESRRARLARATEDRLAGRGTFLAMTKISAPERVVGVIQVRNIAGAPLHGCAIGYGIDRREEGKGLMREGVSLVCRWAFDVLGLHRIEAGYSVKNERSARVLERLGFVKEGLQRKYLYIDGEWHDHVSTSLINDAWHEHP